ncbi:MAG: IclR family transcriptional regulator [Ardenticatenia bacterium]|nr:IclR family transcriptional regulator [Ardenticatenia bacterium]
MSAVHPTSTTNTPEIHLVPAVERAARILLAFESGDVEYGVTELSRLLQINKSTAYAILNTLVHFGFLERNEVTKKYRLGPALLQLGHLVQSRTDLREVARPLLRTLAEEFRQTAILGQFTVEHDILTVDAVVPEGTLSISTSVGRRLPHSAGAFGKVFHAALPLKELDALLAHQGLRRFTNHTIVDVAAYKRELVKVRTLGYALDQEEYLEGVCAVAAPIVDRDGHVIASLCRGLLFPSGRAGLRPAHPQRARGVPGHFATSGGHALPGLERHAARRGVTERQPVVWERGVEP